jgi:hypothetical protein
MYMCKSEYVFKCIYIIHMRVFHIYFQTFALSSVIFSFSAFSINFSHMTLFYIYFKTLLTKEGEIP